MKDFAKGVNQTRSTKPVNTYLALPVSPLFLIKIASDGDLALVEPIRLSLSDISGEISSMPLRVGEGG